MRAYNDTGKRSESDQPVTNNSECTLLRVEIKEDQFRGEEGEPYTIYELRVMLKNPRTGGLMASNSLSPDIFSTLESLTERLEDYITSWTDVSHPSLPPNDRRLDF